MSLWVAYAVTFIASFCILVIEIVAGRILAPFVGVSLYTWTSIIGVVLAGISIGAYTGGKIADLYPSRRTLGLLLFFSGVAALSIPPLTNLIAGYSFPVSLMWRILIVTSIIFFIPSCILGMISPVVVKLSIQNLERVGNIVGKIYAFSTLGSIIGTFLSGFYLISLMGTRNILLLMGFILIVTSILFGSLFKKKVLTAAVLLLPALFVLGAYDYAYKPLLGKDVYYYRESDYFTIKLRKAAASGGSKLLDALVLDNLIHSYVDMKNPLHIAYKYERIYADILKWEFPRDARFSSLTIGGGGYTFPRYMEAFYPNARIDVVEIDPEITRIVHTYLGLPPDTRIRSYNTDGRWFVMNCRDRYDLVFTDAFNDLTIPYHLTTKEFAAQLKNILEPEGILLSNIIDDFQAGAFLPSYIRTLMEVFGEHNVRLISVSPSFKDTGISTFIVIAWKGRLDMQKFEAYLGNAAEDKVTSALVPEELLHKLLADRYSAILTDDYAPVDNLTAPVFEARFGYNRKDR